MGMKYVPGQGWVYTFGPDDAIRQNQTLGMGGPKIEYPTYQESNVQAAPAAIQRRRADAGKSYLPAFAGGGTNTPSVNASRPPRPTTPFVSRPGQTFVNGREQPAVNAPRPYKASPSLSSTPPAGQPFVAPQQQQQNPLDPIYQLALKLAGDVGPYPGAVDLPQVNMPHFDRWAADKDFSGLFDPIQAEYAPVIDTLYNNLQGSMGNIQQNLQNQWGGVEEQLAGQWAGVEQDQQQAFQERDAELRRLATELGVPESAMMTDPSLERWGRENERLKQLNNTLKTGSMGTLDTLAESNAASIGAYGPAMEAARGQSMADMLLSIATQRGQLGSDLTNLESQYNSQASLNEMDLYEQLVGAARDYGNQEYDRRVQGWSMRNEAAQDAMKNWEDFYLAQEEAKAKAAEQDAMNRFFQSNETVKSENAGLWEPVNRRLEQEGLMGNWQDMVTQYGNPNAAAQQIWKMAGGPNVPMYEGEGTSDFINRLAPDQGLFSNIFKVPRALRSLRTRQPSAEVQQARLLQQILKSGGLFNALNAGNMGIPGSTLTTQEQAKYGG